MHSIGPNLLAPGAQRKPRFPLIREKESLGISPRPSSWRVIVSLDVAVEHELPGVRPKRHGVDLLLALVFDPGVDDVLREDSAFQQERVVLLERVEGLCQRAWHRLDLRLLLALELVDVLVDRLRRKYLVLDFLDPFHGAVPSRQVRGLP